MKQLIFLLITIFVFSAISPVIAQTPEDEKIAKSLYLKASKAIRAENYQEAVKLLTQILDEYSDSEVALRADEKLSEIADEAKIAGLPKTPGFYLVESSGGIVELPQKPLKQGSPYAMSITWATFSEDAITRIYADELSKFIVYRPKGNLQDVSWNGLGSLGTTNAEGVVVPSGNWRLWEEWEVPSVVGKPFGSSQVVFEEIKPGMWEVGFPTVFSPSSPYVYGLTDGSGKVGLLVVEAKMVHAFYPVLEMWDKASISAVAAGSLAKQLKKHSTNPDLHFFDAILNYKAAYKANKPQTEALAIARQAVELSSQNEVTPKVVTDLNALIGYCLADSTVSANAIHPDDAPEVKSRKYEALQSAFFSELPPDLFWVQEQIARNHAHMGEFDEAIMVAEKAVKTFKEKKPKTGISLFGVTLKVEVQIGPPKPPEALDIHDALTCYTLKPEWERIKDLKKEMESEKFLGQAVELIEAGGTDKEIEKALKEAKGKNKNNIRCYEAMVDFYNKIGKPKDAEKAQKDIKKANERITKLEMNRKNS